MNHHVVLSTLVCVATCFSVNADSVVERLAPDNTVAVLRVKNVEQCVARAKETSLWRLWKSDDVQKMVMEQDGKNFDEMLEEMADELDLEADDFVSPTGEMGLVLFTMPNENSGMPEPAFVMYGDWGPGADKTEGVLKAMLEKGQDEGDWEWEEQEIEGRTVHLIEFAVDEMGDEFGGGGMGMPDPQQMLEDVGKVYLTRVGNGFLAASHEESLARSFTAIEDSDQVGIGASDDYQQLSGMLGDNEGSLVILFEHAMDFLAGSEGMGMMMMFKPMLTAAFGEMNGMGMSLSLDHDEAMGQFNMAIGMPNGKSGLPALIDTETPRATLPRFVGSDTVSYSRINFEFDGLAGFLTTFIRSNPFLQMQMGEMVPTIETEVKEICATLTPEVHMIGTFARPISMETVQSYYAVRCTNPEAFEEKIAKLGPQMGMEPRDFLGHRLYAMQMDAMMPGMAAEEMAVGIGGGYVFAGQSRGVEAALRAVSNSDSSGLAVDETFDDAINVLDGNPSVGWGYTQTVDAMEGQSEIKMLTEAAMLEEMKREFPEFADEMQAEFDAARNNAMDYDLLRQYVGPMVWQMNATGDGFITRMYLIEADQ